eukprot:CAMPEP_0203637892 /NCGR_PEP_ID=MMETSP0088-20131115/4081_1 /ASSEMBLY_ACC=CAM_ASM_001087 /TAXON_ID=426623 /ORGANISM="Chaetoceros affinis, Strain CCMP159" /LENGTH=403 /DNA_ID=CAMNT_0050492431 /DNA_START=155 /DNA_END=1366 /DNA_ORIENTATION=+
MESTPQQTAEGKAVVTVLAAVLERLVKSNANSAASSPSSSNTNTQGTEVTKFHALKAPGISIKQYLERIHKYASCSTECFVLALIYIDRLIQNNNFILSELNVHRVVITAILLAAKFFDDAYYNNAYYAKVGGVLVSEMNGLEVEFLFRINFSLHVKPDVFLKYQDELVSHAVGAGYEQQQQQHVQLQQQAQPQSIQVQVQDNIAQSILQQSSILVKEKMVVDQGPQHQKQQVHVQQQIYEQTHEEQQFTAPVQTQVPQGMVTQTMPSQMPCGNVTPSPPQNMDYSHQQQQQQQIVHTPQEMTFPPQQYQQHQQQVSNTAVHYPHHSQGPNVSIQKVPDYSRQQQPQQAPQSQLMQSKNYQIQNSRIHPTTELLYNTCCPYGGRFNQNASSPILYNTARVFYQ